MTISRQAVAENAASLKESGAEKCDGEYGSNNR